VPLAVLAREAGVISVLVDSPYKTLKDLVDAVKANPGGIIMAISGLMSPPHLAYVQFERLVGMQFQYAHFDGTVPNATSLMAGHVDVSTNTINAPGNNEVKGGQTRTLEIMDDQPSNCFPGLPTFEQQSNPFRSHNNYTVLAPGVLPRRWWTPSRLFSRTPQIARTSRRR